LHRRLYKGGWIAYNEDARYSFALSKRRRSF
jgi:hypothetical protein